MGNPCNEILGNHSKGLPWVFTQSGPWMARCGDPRISARAKEPDEVGPETERGLCLLWSLKVRRRKGAKVT
ncbi:hypothetical protein B1F69_06340 [Pseudomonas syringae]|nr:hypothetical protein B1F69_06340 [Pseudomonas syringae]BBN61974.1 hypothetical protein KUIN1_11640 [Pseudomonas sp. KUIN-1]